MTDTKPSDVDVRMIETVTGDFMTEPGEPFWRIEIDGYCADFDHEEAAKNFAAAINARAATTLAAQQARIAELVEMIRDMADAFTIWAGPHDRMSEGAMRAYQQCADVAVDKLNEARRAALKEPS